MAGASLLLASGVARGDERTCALTRRDGLDDDEAHAAEGAACDEIASLRAAAPGRSWSVALEKGDAALDVTVSRRDGGAALVSRAVRVGSIDELRPAVRSAVLALAAAEARAMSPPSRAQPPETRERWYGWQTLLVDAASVGIGAGGIAAQSPAVLLVSAGAYLLGGPIVHVANGRDLAAGGSLGLRFALPILTGVMGYASQTGAAADCEAQPGSGYAPKFCFQQLSGAAGGILIGAGLAMVIDAFVLGREDVPVRRTVGSW